MTKEKLPGDDTTGPRHRPSFRFGAEFLRLGDPALDPPRQADRLADLVGRLGAEGRDLPVMEDAEIVELLLDRRGYAGQLLEIVGDPTRARKRLEAEFAGGRRRGRKLFDDRRFRRADIDAGLALGARNAVDRRLGDQVAIEADRAAGIVIAGDDDR